MIRQHPRVQHVGVRQHQIRLVANPTPLGGRRVAVIDARSHGGFQFSVIAREFE
jgi:hypothetical protein